MANFNPSSSFSNLLPLILLIVIVVPSATAISASDISQICEKSMDTTLCLSFLQSTPGISTADLVGVGGIILDVTSKKAADTKDYVKTLLGKATDHKLKEAYKTCLENYDDAVGDISEAKASLASKDYESTNIRTSAAQTEMDTCGSAVKGITYDDGDTELLEKNRHLFNVLDIVLIIANKLKG
ncbi:Pectinesterase inhibitor [Linum perenne]